MKRSILKSIALATLLATLVIAGTAVQAQARYDSEHWRFDDRYHHDHYYPRFGYVAPVLPGGALTIGYRGGNYFYHGGVWFRPVGGRYVVIAPPFGIVVPLLPPSYATLWIGGAPYYYANGAYYAPAAGGYEVVEAPPGADSVQPAPQSTDQQPPPAPPQAPPPMVAQQTPGAPVYSPRVQQSAPVHQGAPANPILYPRNGQSPQQSEADQQDCNRWATSQPGAMADAGVFQRAAAACLDGRGYTVR